MQSTKPCAGVWREQSEGVDFLCHYLSNVVFLPSLHSAPLKTPENTSQLVLVRSFFGFFALKIGYHLSPLQVLPMSP